MVNTQQLLERMDIVLRLSFTEHFWQVTVTISCQLTSKQSREKMLGILCADLYPGKTFLGGKCPLVRPHSLFTSTSSRVNMLQLEMEMTHLTPEPDLCLPFILMSCTEDWLRDNPAWTNQGCCNLSEIALSFYILDQRVLKTSLANDNKFSLKLLSKWTKFVTLAI